MAVISHYITLISLYKLYVTQAQHSHEFGDNIQLIRHVQ